MELYVNINNAMRLTRPVIPKETDADVAMSVIIPNIDEEAGSKVSFLYKFEGVADRTASGDAISIEIKNKTNTNPSVKFTLKRDSIYHILPEYLFHPIDRYAGTKGDVAEFEKRYKEQKEQEGNALTYFNFFDQSYQKQKVNFQIRLNENIFKGNQFLSDFICSNDSFNRENPYIKAVLPCIPWIRNYRGNKEMVEVALGYAFSGNALVKCEWKDCRMELKTDIHSSLDGEIDDLYCGPSFLTGSYTWFVRYQVIIETERRVIELKTSLQEFSVFFKNWFLHIEDDIVIEFGDWKAAPKLTEKDSQKGIFLNYSTQLI